MSSRQSAETEEDRLRSHCRGTRRLVCPTITLTGRGERMRASGPVERVVIRGLRLNSPCSSSPMDDRKDCDLPCVQVVNEAVGSHEELANRSVTKFRNDLTTFRHFGERHRGVFHLLHERRRIGLGSPSNVFEQP